MLLIQVVLFIKAKPSLELKETGFIPAFDIASAPDIILPRYSASPFPIKTRTICAEGAKSPLEPTEPFSGIKGWTPLFNISTIV